MMPARILGGSPFAMKSAMFVTLPGQSAQTRSVATTFRAPPGKVKLGAFCASEGRGFLKPRLELLSSVIGEGVGEGEGGCRFVRHDGWMDGWMDGCAF